MDTDEGERIFQVQLKLASGVCKGIFKSYVFLVENSTDSVFLLNCLTSY